MVHFSAVCLLAKNENSYINEWLEWHLNKLGFMHVYIYDNESDTPIESSIDDKYKDNITIIEWTKEKHRMFIQLDCYTHFIEHFGEENKWVAFIDADEFIRLINNDNINNFLLDYENYNGIFMEWLIYNADGQYNRTDGFVRDRFKSFTTCKDIINNGKCIIKPNEYKHMGPHFPFSCKTKYNVVYSNKEFCKAYAKHNAPLDKIVVDHYFTKSYEEWCEKIKRGSCDPLCVKKIDNFFDFNPDMRPKEV